MSRRALIATGVAFAMLLGAGGVLFAFGTPQAPPLAQVSTASQPVEPAEQPVAVPDGEVPPPDPSVPLAIEIPGCVCHSEDPKIVEEHAAYRMNQCAGCHAGAVPTGQ